MSWNINTVYVEYALYLPKLNQWIVETSDDRIWLKGDIDKRYTDTSYGEIYGLMCDICFDKHLKEYEDIVVVTITDEHKEEVL